MSNHLHILAVGDESKLKLMFEQIKKYLRRMAEDAGRTMDWEYLHPAYPIDGKSFGRKKCPYI